MSAEVISLACDSPACEMTTKIMFQELASDPGLETVEIVCTTTLKRPCGQMELHSRSVGIGSKTPAVRNLPGARHQDAKIVNHKAFDHLHRQSRKSTLAP
jgi:hypothetical protein